MQAKPSAHTQADIVRLFAQPRSAPRGFPAKETFRSHSLLQTFAHSTWLQAAGWRNPGVWSPLLAIPGTACRGYSDDGGHEALSRFLHPFSPFPSEAVRCDRQELGGLESLVQISKVPCTSCRPWTSQILLS